MGLAAKAGDEFYRDFYLTYPNWESLKNTARHCGEIFPEARRGSFTWNEEMQRWVWTDISFEPDGT